MQLKELTLKELLALFDSSTHGRISAYFQDPEIHHIVVFANHFQPDMGLLTVGPKQDCTSVEQAKRAIIDRKFAKYVVRCQNCPPEKRKDDAVLGLVRPIDRSAHLAVADRATSPMPVAMRSAGEEAAFAAREAALKAIESDLKQREDELVEREEYVTRSEESLIDKMQKQERRAAELEQMEDNLRKGKEQLAGARAAFEARVAAFNAAHPDAVLS